MMFRVCVSESELQYPVDMSNNTKAANMERRKQEKEQFNKVENMIE